MVGWMVDETCLGRWMDDWWHNWIAGWMIDEMWLDIKWTDGWWHGWMDGLMLGWMMKGWLVKLLGGWLIVDIWVRWWMGGLMGWFMYGWVIKWMDGWLDRWLEGMVWMVGWLAGWMWQSTFTIGAAQLLSVSPTVFHLSFFVVFNVWYNAWGTWHEAMILSFKCHCSCAWGRGKLIGQHYEQCGVLASAGTVP